MAESWSSGCLLVPLKLTESSSLKPSEASSVKLPPAAAAALLLCRCSAKCCLQKLRNASDGTRDLPLPRRDSTPQQQSPLIDTCATRWPPFLCPMSSTTGRVCGVWTPGARESWYSGCCAVYRPWPRWCRRCMQRGARMSSGWSVKKAPAPRCPILTYPSPEG